MDYSNLPATHTAVSTYDISFADLAGANAGQRNDLLAFPERVYRTPDNVLYSVSGASLIADKTVASAFVWSGTEAEYNAIAVKDPRTVYVVTE